ncbi:MAG: hypothetical protein ACRDBH_01655 [Bosea sp. (in: a-proteobacteria)]
MTPTLTQIAKGALLFGGGLFGIGFLLAIPRELLLKPWLGEMGAVIVELPIVLGLSWLFARFLMRGAPAAWLILPRLMMGASALASLLLAEILLSVLALGQTWAAALASLVTPKGLAGLAAQALACSFPSMQQRLIRS